MAQNNQEDRPPVRDGPQKIIHNETCISKEERQESP
jgi:hypothetical protein